MTIPPASLLPFPHRASSPSVPSPRTSTTNPFKVAFGQLTFDAEGTDRAGPYFSRTAHWPGGSSGVTIGRGYDMGQRTRLQVVRELVAAGVSLRDASALSSASGLRGAQAERFLGHYRDNLPSITPEQQKRLFETITSFETIADIKRILGKPDLISQYGEIQWEELPLEMREILFDLRYRGDYTPATRACIQPYIVTGDLAGLADAMSDVDFWRQHNVPLDRIGRRAEYAQAAAMAFAKRACA